MFSLRWFLPLLLVVSLLPLQAQAAKKKTHHKKSATATQAVVAAPTPSDFADSFHEALRTRNRDQILAMLAPNAVVFETGYVEATRDEFVKKNLSDDADFAGVTDYRPLSRGVIGDGKTVSVLTMARIQGIFGDQRVDLEQTETMILIRTSSSWEIVHLHWSAHPRQANDAGLDALPVPPPVATPDPAPTPELKSSAEPTAPVQPEAKPEDVKSP